MLDSLKSYGGPFTDDGEVEQYQDDQSMDDKGKEQRMKLEIQFARESTTLLPKADHIFRIQVTLPSGKRKMKTALEFGEALTCYLEGEVTGRPSSIIRFSLDKLVSY